MSGSFAIIWLCACKTSFVKLALEHISKLVTLGFGVTHIDAQSVLLCPEAICRLQTLAEVLVKLAYSLNCWGAALGIVTFSIVAFMAVKVQVGGTAKFPEFAGYKFAVITCPALTEVAGGESAPERVKATVA